MSQFILGGLGVVLAVAAACINPGAAILAAVAMVLGAIADEMRT